MWWSNNDQRRHQKDNIKMTIKQKSTKKTSQAITSDAGTPPGLLIDHTLSTSIESNASAILAECTGVHMRMHSSQYIEQTYGEPRQSFGEEALDMNFFDFSNGVPALLPKFSIELDDNDHRLFAYFIQFVLPSILPILETNQHSSARTDLIISALESSKSTCTVV
jgi:hypothetical protein